MKLRRWGLLGLVSAVLSTAAICNPTPVPPPPIPAKPIAIHTCVPKDTAGQPAQVWIDGALVPAAYGKPASVDATGAIGYAALPGNVTVFNVHATAAGYPQYGAVVQSPGTNNSVYFFGTCQADQRSYPGANVIQTAAWTPNVPPVQPLPPPPTRDQLARVKAGMQGITVTTQALGTIPSWGPEVGMLGPVDRQAVYAAHKAAGMTHFVIDTYIHYTEAGVSYPNNTAASNDWTQDNWATLTTITAEIVRAGLYPVIMQGADELPFATVQAQTPGLVAALRNYPAGDLTQYSVFCQGFDSVVPIANAPPADTSVQGLVSLIQAQRAAIGPNGVLAIELPIGWAFWGPDALSGAGSYTSPAGQDLDVVLQEFNSPPGPPAKAPAIVGGTWDAEHQDFAPVFADPAAGNLFQSIWQIAARTVNGYQRPSDEVTARDCPAANNVPVTGNPSVTRACVYADVNPSTYTAGGTPRGRYYVIAFEIATYSWTHGFSMSASDIVATGPYFAGMGYDAVCVPNAPSPVVVTVHRPIAWFRRPSRRFTLPLAA